MQSDHSRVWHAGGLRSSQHLPDSAERDAQLPGQNLEWENKRSRRPTDQQQLRKDAAPENSRAPEQRRENRKDWVAPTHPVPVPWSAEFRSVRAWVCVNVCTLKGDLLFPMHCCIFFGTIPIYCYLFILCWNVTLTELSQARHPDVWAKATHPV